MNEHYKKIIQSSQVWTGPKRWQRIGDSVYRKEGVYVWKEGRHWYRTELPTFTICAALASVAIGPLGLFSNSSGPYKTMKAARRG